MPAPLMPLVAKVISRLVSANISQSVTGLISRATARSGAKAAAAGGSNPGNARSAFDFVMRYKRQMSARRSARARRTFTRNAPGFAQAHRWRNVNKAFGQLQRARSAKQSALQIGDPLKVQQAEEQEERAKQRLAKETKALLESFVGLRRGLVGAVVALHTIPHAIQAIGRAHVELIRSRSGTFSGRTAGALVRYDVNERLNKISSARATSASDSRMIQATQGLNNELKPLTDAMHVLSNEVLTEVIRGTTLLVSVMRTFSPLVGAVESLARYFKDKQGEAKEDITTAMFKGLVEHTRRQADHGRREWKDATKPPDAQGKRP